MLLSRVVALVGLAVSAAAAADPIVAALETVTNSTATLNRTIAHWNGQVRTVAPIAKRSTQLLLDIHAGIEAAGQSKTLETTGAEAVAVATQDLVTATRQTIKTIVAAKPQFDRVAWGGVIRLNLEIQEELSQDLAVAIIAKVPKDLQSTAESLVAPIQTAFEKAIKVYTPLKKKTGLRTGTDL